MPLMPPGQTENVLRYFLELLIALGQDAMAKKKRQQGVHSGPAHCAESTQRECCFISQTQQVRGLEWSEPCSVTRCIRLANLIRQCKQSEC